MGGVDICGLTKGCIANTCSLVLELPSFMRHPGALPGRLVPLQSNVLHIWAHARDVFEGCHGRDHTVGGTIPFNVAHYPATIDIIPTTGLAPP
jgi:hypothetical protein